MSRPIIAIYNPISGRRNVLGRLQRIRDDLHSMGVPLEIRATEYPGHATQLASRVNGNARAVLVAGGDGTLCEVVNGLRDRKLPVALLPAGTENLLAKTVGLPPDPAQAARILVSGQTQSRDAAEVNGRVFLAVGGVGFDAECLRKLIRFRRGHITHTDYCLPIWRTFWEHRFPMLRLCADGAEVFRGRGLVIFGLVQRYALGLPVLPKADPTDGLLDAVIFPCTTRRVLVGHAIHVAARRPHGDAIHLQCKSISVTSDSPTDTQVDGELFCSTPIECRCLPAHVQVLVGDAESGGN